MPGADALALVYATFPTLEEAERIGGELVERRLAACVNIIPGMISIYIWQGAKHREQETVILIKTRQALADDVVAQVRALHSYDNPAVIIIPIAGGSADFLQWIAAQTAATAAGP